MVSVSELHRFVLQSGVCFYNSHQSSLPLSLHISSNLMKDVSILLSEAGIFETVISEVLNVFFEI